MNEKPTTHADSLRTALLALARHGDHQGAGTDSACGFYDPEKVCWCGYGHALDRLRHELAVAEGRKPAAPEFKKPSEASRLSPFGDPEEANWR